MSDSDSEWIDGSKQTPEENVGPEIPSISNPPEEAVLSSLPDSYEVDSGLRVMFWKLVFLYKFALIGLTLGVLLLVFDTGPDIGAEILAGALVLFAYTLFRTKRGKERLESGEFRHTDGASGSPGADDTDEETQSGPTDVERTQTDDENLSSAQAGGE